MANGQLPVYISAYYCSQIDNTANTSLDGLSSALSQVRDIVGNSEATVILTGDFNCPDICWDSLSTNTGSKVVGISEKPINVSTQNGLQQLQRESTKRDSILDLFFTSNVSLMSIIDTIPGISTDTEHEAIVVDLNLKAEITKSVPHRVYLWNKVKWDSVKAATSEFVSALRPVVGQWMNNGSPLRIIWPKCWKSLCRRNLRLNVLTSHGSAETWGADAGKTETLQ